GVFVDVPYGIDASGERFGLDENADRRRVEVEAQGRAQPAFHFLADDIALIPVAKILRGAAVLAGKDLRITASKPRQFGVGALEWLRAELQGESLRRPRNGFGLDQARDHLGHSQHKSLLLQAGARIVKNPGIAQEVRVND